MMIHFPIGSIKRNLQTWIDASGDTILDSFLGTSKWRDVVKADTDDDAIKLLGIFKDQLVLAGYPEENLYAFSDTDKSSVVQLAKIRNSRNAPLYYLILVSRHSLGKKMWDSVLKYLPSGQKRLF